MKSIISLSTIVFIETLQAAEEINFACVNDNVYYNVNYIPHLSPPFNIRPGKLDVLFLISSIPGL